MISMVIPTYSTTEELEEMAIICALTYRQQVDQLIICEDGGQYNKELASIGDIYLYSKQNAGFTRNVNRGWKLSEGDYTIIANSDTQLFEGKLKDLCIPGKVTCPKVSGYNVVQLCGAFFCVPKEIKEQYGLLREDLPDKNYGSDSEYEKRTWDLFQYVPSVDIYHKGGETTTAVGIAHP